MDRLIKNKKRNFLKKLKEYELSKFQVEHYKEQRLLNLKAHIFIYYDADEHLIHDFNKFKGKDLLALLKWVYLKKRVIKIYIKNRVYLYTIGSYKIVSYLIEIPSIIKNSHEVVKNHK